MKKPGGNTSVEKSLDSFSDRTLTVLGGHVSRTGQRNDCITVVDEVEVSLLLDASNKYMKFVNVFVGSLHGSLTMI